MAPENALRVEINGRVADPQTLAGFADIHKRGASVGSCVTSRTYSIGDGDRCRRGKPLEHTTRSPSPALVQQLNVLVVTWGVSESCCEFSQWERVTGKPSV